MPGRKINFADYRYGFNGKEADTNREWGSLTHYDYGFRIYNPAIARFLSVDPLAPEYPWYTPYQFAGNMPIIAIDLDGLEQFIVVRWEENDKIKSEISVIVGSTPNGHASVFRPSSDPSVRVQYIDRETNNITYSSTLRDIEFDAIRSVTNKHITYELGEPSVIPGTYKVIISENKPSPAPPIVNPVPTPKTTPIIKPKPKPSPTTGNPKKTTAPVTPSPSAPKEFRLNLESVGFDGNQAEIDREGSWEWGSDDITDLLEPAVKILRNNPTAQLEFFVGTRGHKGRIVMGGPFEGKPVEQLLDARYNEIVRQLRIIDPKIDLNRVKYHRSYKTKIGFKGNVKYTD